MSKDLYSKAFELSIKLTPATYEPMSPASEPYLPIY